CRQLPHAAYPQLRRPGPGLAAYLALLRLGVTVPRLLPGARWALTPPFHPYPWIKGGLFSVALSVASRRPGVTWQSALWSSDFPRHATPTSMPRPSRPTAIRHQTTGSGRVGARLPRSDTWCPLALDARAGYVGMGLARQPPQQAAQAVERHALPEARRLVGGEPETVVFLEHQALEAGPVAGGQRGRRQGHGVRDVEAAGAVQRQELARAQLRREQE